MTFPRIGRSTPEAAEQARQDLIATTEALLNNEALPRSVDKKLARAVFRLVNSDLPPFEVFHTSAQALANLFASGYPNQALMSQLQETIKQTAPAVYPQDTSDSATNIRNQREVDAIFTAIPMTHPERPFPSAYEKAHIIADRIAEETATHGDLSRLEQPAVPYDPFADKDD